MKKTTRSLKIKVVAETVRKLATVELVDVVGALRGTVAGGVANSCYSCQCTTPS